jgi:Ser-tRNA(Ala) deacylase AlaX
MSEKYFIEGHKSKTKLEDEDTLVFDGESCETLEKATAKAKEYLEKGKDVSLTVIYKENLDGMREGVKFIYKGEEGELEESSLFWGCGDRCFEG